MHLRRRSPTAALPGDYDVGLLITIYAIMILGGFGSIMGIVVGAAIVINVSFSCCPENPQGNARILFYAIALLLLVLGVRPWWRLGAVLAGVVAFGVAAVHAIVVGGSLLSWTGEPCGRGRLAGVIGEWVVIPQSRERSSEACLRGVLVAAILVYHAAARSGAAALYRHLISRHVRVGELLARRQPAVARWILFGALLVALMNVRPQGLFGTAERRGRVSEKALLELRGVDKTFGGLTVMSELDLVVGENEIVSVIGPNGAGKTTVFNLVTGVYRPDEGDILLDGRSIVGLAPHTICRRGVARTFQTLRLFLNMTVKENVMAAAYGHTRATVFESILRTPAHGARRRRSTGSPRSSWRSSASG